MSESNGNGKSTEGKTNWTGNFLSRITPGNWIVITGMLLTGVWNYQALSNQSANNMASISEVKTLISTLASREYVDGVARSASTDVATLKGSVDGMHNEIRTLNDALSSRINTISDRVVTNGNTISSLSATVDALKDTLAELRRQSSFRTRGSFETGSTSPPFTGGVAR